MQRPWYGNAALTAEDHARGDKPWDIVAPSAIPMDDGWLMPHELTLKDLEKLREDWRQARCARSRRISMCWRFIAPTAICCMNSCRRCPIIGAMPMAATAPGA
jgi:hypothetical protein